MRAIGGYVSLFFQGILKASPLILLGAFAGAGFWGIRENLYADPGFSIQWIRVEADGDLAQIKSSMLEKKYLNRSIFSVSPKEVSRWLEQDPRVQRAVVTREFPHSLKVEIEDRIPLIELSLSEKGPFYRLAEDGVVVGIEKVSSRDYLRMEAYDSKIAVLREGGTVQMAGFKESIRLLRRFWTHPIAQTETPDKVCLDRLGNVTLVLTRGPELRFGRDPSLKWPSVDSALPLLRGPERERILYIELQYQDLVVRKKDKVK